MAAARWGDEFGSAPLRPVSCADCGSALGGLVMRDGVFVHRDPVVCERSRERIADLRSQGIVPARDWENAE